MKRDDVHSFEKLAVQLGSLYQEMSTLTKKSPNDGVNPFKLQLINKTLEKCNEFLGMDYRPFAEFEVFLSDDMPSNSDVTLILSQYIECAEKLRADNIYQDAYWYWNIEDVDPEDKEGRIRTTPPKKFAGR